LAIYLPSLLMPLSLFSGCFSGEFSLAEARGRVVCKGQPVAGGSITFSPLAETAGPETGKAATASVGADGTFVLTTQRSFDGAIVGKHRVQYTPPEEGNEEESSDELMTEETAATVKDRARNQQQLQQRAAKRRLQCVQRSEVVVEVKSDGQNDFTIELTPAGNAVDLDE
jgi:hypothetical protein